MNLEQRVEEHSRQIAELQRLVNDISSRDLEKKKVDQSEFRVGVTDEMKSTAYLLFRHERCKEDWKKFLEELQGRSYITEKQKKFFAVIHKECLGHWPDKGEKTAPPPAKQEADLDFSKIF